jgi:NTP pyrophosphatase (non-canonical NTP hydrolase)
MTWTDRNTTVGTIRDAVRAFNAERDWKQFHSPRNLAMAVSCEAAELLELYLWSTDAGPQPPVPTRAGRVGEEAADVLICLMSLCDAAGIDLAAAVEKKLELNARKYPVGKARGRSERSEELG